ncbi:site-specific integrase [Arenibaculum pallidiluteum]|uniref:site-specific integrase n=1 Tax=Arenibaculum pallidiluteum TaxID=2812559 RepID=UPI001A9735FB|nr:site-specific integrase [Arenibaculum pallidiluteum]
MPSARDAHPNWQPPGQPDDVLARLPHPVWLVNGSVLDNAWTIRTDDHRLKRSATVTIRFDVPLAPGPVLLTDPSFGRDLLTAKLYAYWGLSASDGWRSEALVTLIDVNALFTLVRWRVSRGVACMADLGREWYEDFCQSLQRRGLEGLVDSEGRMRAYLAEIDAGYEELPVRLKGRKRFLYLDEVYRRIGFVNSRQVSDEARLALLTAARSRGLGFFEPSRALDESDQAEGDGRLSCMRMAPLIAVWERLYSVRHRMPHDPMEFDAFEGGGSPFRVAVALGSPLSGRTKTIPAEQACFLIDRALRWVLLYSEDLEKVLTSFKNNFRSFSRYSYETRLSASLDASFSGFFPRHLGPAAVGAPWPLNSTAIGPMRMTNRQKGVGLRAAILELLPAAAAIVIATFSARRSEEIASLRAGCLTRGEDGEAWLGTWIAKTKRDSDLIPVPEVVAKAVGILERLSSVAREREAVPWIFNLTEILRDDRHVKFDLPRKLMDFARFIHVPLLANGTEWVFSPHQFRRFFAITYYYRFRNPSLTALSDFMRHHDPDMTRRYITEAAGGGLIRMAEERRIAAVSSTDRRTLAEKQRAFSDFQEVGAEFRADRYKAVACGRETLGGFGGERLKTELQELVRQAKRMVEVRSARGTDLEQTFDELLIEFVKPRRLEPNGMGHSYCKCSGDHGDLAVAACLNARQAAGGDVTGASGPDHAYAADMTCSSCPHNVQFTENRAYWDDQVTADEATAASASGLLATVAAARAKAGRCHIQRCFLDVRPIVDPLTLDWTLDAESL